MNGERKDIIELIQQARHGGARQSKACEVIGISAKTLQRWESPANEQDGRIQNNRAPKNKLTPLERQRVIKVANAAEFAHLPPSQIVPKLADRGEYIASESTFYRILNEYHQLKHRDKSKPVRPVNKPKALTALAPNQLYTWDITWLATQIRGVFLYLYLVLDIYSRKIVGWQVHAQELSVLAADLMRDICQREGIQRHQVTLHSDNGSPMKGATLLATLQDLGVMTSFSRPSVSNDNPFSESMFRTLKYRPAYPEKPFADIHEARGWVAQFVLWYNYEHQHSGIRFVTPHQRHSGEDVAILAKRVEVYQRAKSNHPNRWSGETRNWDRIEKVHLNPGKEKSEIKKNRVA